MNIKRLAIGLTFLGAILAGENTAKAEIFKSDKAQIEGTWYNHHGTEAYDFQVTRKGPLLAQMWNSLDLPDLARQLDETKISGEVYFQPSTAGLVLRLGEDPAAVQHFVGYNSPLKTLDSISPFYGLGLSFPLGRDTNLELILGFQQKYSTPNFEDPRKPHQERFMSEVNNLFPGGMLLLNGRF